MGTSGVRHTRSALALGLALCALTLTVLTLGLLPGGDDEVSSPAVSSPTGASPIAPKPGPISTSFDSPDSLSRAEVQRAQVTAGAAHSGTSGLEVRSTGGDAYVRWDAGLLGEGHPYWTFRAWMRVVDWTPSESVDLFTVRNLEVKNNFDLFVGAPYRRLQWDLYRENSGEAPPFEPGRWYLIEAKGSFATSTYTADVRIDGVNQQSITSIDQPPSAVSEFILGSVGTVKTNRAQFDDFAVELGDSPLPFLGRPPESRSSSPSTSTSTAPSAPSASPPSSSGGQS